MQSHWNPAVHGLTGNVQRVFLEMDTELFEDWARVVKKEAQVELEEICNIFFSFS